MTIRVLHFGRFFHDQFGGIQRHVGVLLNGLTAQGVMVANVVANDALESDIILSEGYPIYRVPSLGLVAGTAIAPSMPFKARQICKRDGFDIAHLHFPDPLSHLVANALPRNVKIVISWHSDIVRQRRLLTLYQPFLDRIVKRADAVLGATAAHFTSSTQLRAVTSPDRLHVVPYGISYAHFDSTGAFTKAEEIRTHYAGRKLIFAVGRHVYYKGYEFLIRAMAHLPNADLILGGRGPTTPALKALASELGLGNRIHFVGRIPEGDLAAFYRACDIFCLPSIEKSEAFGLVQLEAMACKKPIVCCELNNGVTVVTQHEKTGLVVPPCNPRALATALRRLLDNPYEAQKMGVAGSTRARTEYSIPTMCEKTVAIYRQILSV